MPVHGSDGTTEPASDTPVSGALPDGGKVADRWHMMEHSSCAFLDTVGQSMRQIRQAVGSTADDNRTQRPRDAQCIEMVQAAIGLKCGFAASCSRRRSPRLTVYRQCLSQRQEDNAAKWSAHFSLNGSQCLGTHQRRHHIRLNHATHRRVDWKRTIDPNISELRMHYVSKPLLAAGKCHWNFQAA